MRRNRDIDWLDWVFLLWFLGGSLVSLAVLACGAWVVVELVQWVTSK